MQPAVPEFLRLEGRLMDPDTGTWREHWMAFFREDVPALAGLAREHGIPMGSLLVVPKPDEAGGKPGRLAKYFEPGELLAPACMIAVETRNACADGPDRPAIRVDPFTVSGWDALRRLAVTDDAAAPAAEGWVDEINNFRDRIEAELEERPASGLPGELVSFVLCCQIVDRVEVAELPAGFDYDMVTRYCVAAQLDRQIALLEDRPLPDPAPGNRRGIESMVGDDIAGQMMTGDGALVRAALVRNASGAEMSFERDFSRRNDTLVRRLFSRLTRTPVEQISCGLAPKGMFEPICSKLDQEAGAAAPREGPGAESGAGDWKQEIAAEIRNVLLDVFGGTHATQARLWEIRGQDVLAVQDFAGSYVYSWPSSDRNVVYVPEGEAAIPMIDPESCPGPEELAAKQERFATLLLAPGESGVEQQMSFQNENTDDDAAEPSM